MKRLLTRGCPLCTLLLAMMLLLSACHDRNDIDEPDTPDSPDAPVELTRIIHPVAVVGGLPGDEFGEGIQKRLGTVGTPESSPVVILTATTLKSQATSVIKQLYEQGKLIVVLNPDDTTDDVLIEDLGAGYSPYSGGSDILVYAFNSNDRHLMLHKEVISMDTDREVEEVDVSDLEGKMDEDGEWEDEDDEYTIDGEAEDDHRHDDKGYYDSSLDALVDWINTYAVEDDGDSNKEEDKKDAFTKVKDDACSVSHYFNFSLYNKIAQAKSSKPDYLNCDGGIVSFKYEIVPLYVHNLEGYTESIAGDYYLVEGCTTIHSGALWQPDKRKHGACSNRLVGYYLKNAYVLCELTKEENSQQSTSIDPMFHLPISPQHLASVELHKPPVPATTVGCTTYDNTISLGFSASATGKASTSDGLSAELNAGFNVNWTKGTSRPLKDLTGITNTDGQHRVGYTITVNNIQKKMSWKDIEHNFPGISRGNLDALQAWIWRVPDGNDGVEQNATVNFFLKFSFQGEYGVYQWWRGATEGHEHLFKTPIFTTSVGITPPSRRPFGILEIKNAARQTICNIRMTRNETGVKYSIPSSYGYNEVARKKLPAGTYKVEYDVVDPYTGEKKSSWYLEDVEISLGHDQETSTTFLSTVNFHQPKTK